MSLTTSPKPADLPAGLFDQQWNEHLIWHVVRNEMLARRQGTHSTKTRGMVRGGSEKPWRQKGTGRARQGTRRAPQWAGGGAVFGPSPRSYGGKVNRKERHAALRAALSMHRERGSLVLLGDSTFDAPSAKAAAKLVADAGMVGKKVVIVCDLEQQAVWKSFRNLRDVMVVPATDLEVADVMWGRTLVLTDTALRHLGAVVSSAPTADAGAAKGGGS